MLFWCCFFNSFRAVFTYVILPIISLFSIKSTYFLLNDRFRVKENYTFINNNKVSRFNFSKPDYSTSSDDNNRISHGNLHACEGSEIIDVVTAVDLVISTDNPLVSVNDRHADNYELNSSNTLALSNGPQLDRDQYTDDQFSIGINHTQLSSANLIVVTDSGHNIYAANINTERNSYQINNFLVHHINTVDLVSDIMPNPQSIRFLDTGVVDMSAGTIDDTNNSNELEISNNVLIIGISNRKHITEQWDSPSVPLQEIEFYVYHNSRVSAVCNIVAPNISLFTDMEGTSYISNILRYFLRCKRVETLFPNTVVRYVNICTDSVRDSDNLSDLEMNYYSIHCRFIQKMEDRRWKINEIYVDHYIILDSYLTTMFRKGFFKILKKLAKSHVFHCNPQKPQYNTGCMSIFHSVYICEYTSI